MYYSNGQYNRALANTETALGMAANDCYLAFNHGLILLAVGRAPAANSAYGAAIDCAERQSSDSRFNTYLDTGVVDLGDLEQARPDLQAPINPAIHRL